MKWLMSVYASYILPLAIVGVPMLWKRIYDTSPDSMMKVAVLEAEASLRSQLVEVEREQNALMVAAYREALDTPEVNDARRALFERASIEHAKRITGFIEGGQAAGQPDSPANTMPVLPSLNSVVHGAATRQKNSRRSGRGHGTGCERERPSLADFGGQSDRDGG
jgi:hypothetical protein